MVEPGERQLGGATAAADLVRRLDDVHRQAALGESDRGGQPIGTGADHHGVVGRRHCRLAIQRR